MLEEYEVTLDAAYLRWSATPWLQGVKSAQARLIAAILENQAGFNEEYVGIAAAAWRDLPVFDLVSVQPIFGPTGKIHYRIGDEVKTKEVVARTNCLGNVCGGLENESEIVDILRKGVTREVLTNLRVSAMTKAVLDTPDTWQIWPTVKRLVDAICRKVPCAAKPWVVMGGTNAERLGVCDKNEAVTTWCRLPDYDVLVDPAYPQSEILVGLHDHTTAGYIYAPYVMLTVTEAVIDEAGRPWHGLWTRCGKCLISGAPYGIVKMYHSHDYTPQYVI